MASLDSVEVVMVDVDAEGDLILEVGRELKNQIQTQEKGGPKPTPVIMRIRVSSKILSLTSPVFEGMLTRRSREDQLPLGQDKPLVLEFPEDAPEPMATLCKVLHYHQDAVRPYSFREMYEATLTSTNFGCTHAMAPWFHRQLHLR
ncbi:hypothetical protein A1O3_06805 [Capronia epimyces CBS 606.96]|uniref:BTB domain-containing protein n=1 Tax=Capronia epimyces CBS 606.96 TaxID=1182542 RepID=W9XRZ9_9EURO|nr:uncharacterized protein A1O3_06805 [Capronia epimyces CBS 606.96]EXJ82988.1 hypothetical protein A1O3_06805 [Capronia epimyces CBS 606.96]